MKLLNFNHSLFVIIFLFRAVVVAKLVYGQKITLRAIHTRYFCTQYWDIKILRYLIILSRRLQDPSKVSSEKNITYLELRAYLGQKNPIAQNYLFIAILCAKIFSVYKPLGLRQTRQEILLTVYTHVYLDPRISRIEKISHKIYPRKTSLKFTEKSIISFETIKKEIKVF